MTFRRTRISPPNSAQFGVQHLDRAHCACVPRTVVVDRRLCATERQLLWEIQLPLALPTILGGLNQTVLTAMVMSVIIAMIGAEGLGLVVLQGIGRLDVGRAAIGGIAIVLLAMTLDRITQALANPEQKRKGPLAQAVSRLFLGARRDEVGQPVMENK